MKRGDVYESKSGHLFVVDSFARHGQACTESMVIYTSLTDTKDSKAGQVWVIDESIFIKRMRKVSK